MEFDTMQDLSTGDAVANLALVQHSRRDPSLSPSHPLVHVEIAFQNPLLKVVWLPGSLGHLLDGLLRGCHAGGFAMLWGRRSWSSRGLAVD